MSYVREGPDVSKEFFFGKTGLRVHLKDPGIDGMIILKLVLNIINAVG